MIEVKRITPPSVLLFAPDGDFKGVVNEYEFHDIRVQIKENQAEGYYVVYKDTKVMIDKNGRIKNWPNGMFDEITNTLINLM